MENLSESIEALINRAESYATTTIALSKLKLINTATLVSSWLISRLSVIIMISLFLFVLSIGIALLLGEILGKTYYGLFVVAGFYLIIAVVSHFFLESWIKKPISAFIIKHALKQKTLCKK